MSVLRNPAGVMELLTATTTDLSSYTFADRDSLKLGPFAKVVILIYWFAIVTFGSSLPIIF